MCFSVGCSVISSPDPIKTLCGADVITVSTDAFICSMEIHDGGCTFRFATPALFESLVLSYDGTRLHALYGDLETDVSENFARALVPLYRTVRAFATETAIQKDKNIRAVTLDETEFLLYYDSEGGMPTRLEMKGEDGTFGFDILSCIENDDNAESTRSN